MTGKSFLISLSFLYQPIESDKKTNKKIFFIFESFSYFLHYYQGFFIPSLISGFLHIVLCYLGFFIPSFMIRGSPYCPSLSGVLHTVFHVFFRPCFVIRGFQYRLSLTGVLHTVFYYQGFSKPSFPSILYLILPT